MAGSGPSWSRNAPAAAGGGADGARVEQAIAAVLHAEQAARSAIAAAASAADARRAAGREAARRIAARAAGRSARVHEAIARRLADELAQASVPPAELGAAPSAVGLDAGQQARVDALARALALGTD